MHFFWRVGRSFESWWMPFWHLWAIREDHKFYTSVKFETCANRVNMYLVSLDSENTLSSVSTLSCWQKMKKIWVLILLVVHIHFIKYNFATPYGTRRTFSIKTSKSRRNFDVEKALKNVRIFRRRYFDAWNTLTCFQRFFDVEISTPYRRLIENARWVPSGTSGIPL